LENGACVKISSPISNCQVENERQICLECEKGYIRSIDKKSCTEKPVISGCATYQHVECRECATNYLMNENYYLDLLYSFNTSRDLQKLTNMRSDFKNNVADSIKFPTCQYKEISNCLVFRTFDKCRHCAPGYFVNKNQ
jgi:hypothetical protein